MSNYKDFYINGMSFINTSCTLFVSLCLFLDYFFMFSATSDIEVLTGKFNTFYTIYCIQ